MFVTTFLESYNGILVGESSKIEFLAIKSDYFLFILGRFLENS